MSSLSSLPRASTRSQRTTNPSLPFTMDPSQYTRRAYQRSRYASPQRSSLPCKVLVSFWVAERTFGRRKVSHPLPQPRKMVSAFRVAKRLRMPPPPTAGVPKMSLPQRRYLYPIRAMGSLARLQAASAGHHHVRNIIFAQLPQYSLLEYTVWRASRRRCQPSKEK